MDRFSDSVQKTTVSPKKAREKKNIILLCPEVELPAQSILLQLLKPRNEDPETWNLNCHIFFFSAYVEISRCPKIKLKSLVGQRR